MAIFLEVFEKEFVREREREREREAPPMICYNLMNYCAMTDKRCEIGCKLVLFTDRKSVSYTHLTLPTNREV